MMQALAAHLWQSTLFALAAGFMTAAFRGNRAHVRYWLWLSASLKFLVPFVLLFNLGSYLQTRMPAARQVASQIATPVVSRTVEEFSGPSVIGTLAQSITATSTIEWIPTALVTIWLVGFAMVAFSRIRGWLKVRAAVRASAAMRIYEGGISEAVEIRKSPAIWGQPWLGFCDRFCCFLKELRSGSRHRSWKRFSRTNFAMSAVMTISSPRFT